MLRIIKSTEDIVKVSLEFLTHFICDLSAEFSVDDIWGVGNWSVPEFVRLLSVLCLRQKTDILLPLWANHLNSSQMNVNINI